MAWTYDATDMSTDLNKVRAEIGDTDTNKQLLTNEIVNSYLSTYDNVFLAAAYLAQGPLKAALLRVIDRTGTGFGASRSQINQHCNELASNLLQRAALGCEPSYGGVSDDDADSLESDDDFQQPTFKSGQHENS